MTRDDVAAAVGHLRDSHSIRGRGMPDILKRAMALSIIADWLARMPDVASVANAHGVLLDFSDREEAAAIERPSRADVYNQSAAELMAVAAWLGEIEG
jgi:hypothetical protein